MAIEENDVIATSSAIAEFHSQNLVDVDGDLIRGERVIGLHECMQGKLYSSLALSTDTIFHSVVYNYAIAFQCIAVVTSNTITERDDTK